MIHPSAPDASPSQVDAWIAAVDHRQPFVAVLGAAGTGKTRVLKLLLDATRRRFATLRLAPTSIAALEIGGQTIHRVLGLRKGKTQRYPKKNALRNVELVVIDEIGAVRADLLDELDTVMCEVRENDAPFGGALVRVFGDFGQLPPVVDKLPDWYATPFAFSSAVWLDAPPEVHQLREVHRQPDPDFVKALAALRASDVATIEQGVDWINANASKTPILTAEGRRAVTLAPLRSRVERINADYMAGLTGEPVVRTATESGTIETKDIQAPARLELKPGAMLVHLVNDRDDPSLVNGTAGTFAGVGSGGALSMETEGGVIHEIWPYTWNNIEETVVPGKPGEKPTVRTRTLGSFTQYPVLPAAAMTIHKAQGKTLSQVNIELGKRMLFDINMAYSAVSRASSNEGLYLSRPLTPWDAVGTDRKGACQATWPPRATGPSRVRM